MQKVWRFKGRTSLSREMKKLCSLIQMNINFVLGLECSSQFCQMMKLMSQLTIYGVSSEKFPMNENPILVIGRHLIRFSLLVWCASFTFVCVIRYNDNVNIFPHELITTIIRIPQHNKFAAGALAVFRFYHGDDSKMRAERKRNGMNGILSEFINYLADHPPRLDWCVADFFRAFVFRSRYKRVFISAPNHIADTWGWFLGEKERKEKGFCSHVFLRA